MEFNEETNTENMEHAAIEAISVVKIMCAIMNDEEDIDAYEEKSKEEMVEIIESINARFPNNDHVSYDPVYLRFGQACINGYNTFGIDFFKQLTKRTDSTQSLCFKGLIDMYMNMLVQNQQLALSLLSDEEKMKIEKDLVNAEDMTDEEFLDTLKS